MFIFHAIVDGWSVKKIDDQSVDLAVIDPPYNLKKDEILSGDKKKLFFKNLYKLERSVL